jgi:hypothetical protein
MDHMRWKAILVFRIDPWVRSASDSLKGVIPKNPPSIDSRPFVKPFAVRQMANKTEAHPYRRATDLSVVSLEVSTAAMSVNANPMEHT